MRYRKECRGRADGRDALADSERKVEGGIEHPRGEQDRRRAEPNQMGGR